MAYDNDARAEEARRKLPLEVLLQQHGHDPKSRVCMFCPPDLARKKKTATVGGKGGRSWFKCFHTSCPTGGESLDEGAWLAQLLGLSNRDGWVTWLKEAGVWREERLSPSVMPGKAPRKSKRYIEETGARSQKTEDGRQKNENLPADGGANPLVAAGLDREPPAGGSERLEANGIPPAGVLATGGLQNEDPVDPDEAADPEAGAENPPHDDDRDGDGDGDDERDGPEVLAHETLALPVGGGPPGDGAGGEDDEFGEDAPWRRCLQVFWERTVLTAEDQMLLWRKRGLLPAVTVAVGLRSSQDSNRAVLEEMGREFPVAALAQSGLWKRDEREGVFKPNSQFYGYGIVRKAAWGETAGHDEFIDRDRNVWGWSYPVLIPYFDEAGAVVSIRPHKGGMKGKPALLYVVRVGVRSEDRKPDAGDRSPNIEPCEAVIVTEGEFKAIALYQVLAGVRHTQTKDRLFEFAAVPGISMTKRRGGGWWIRDGLDTLLAQRKAKSVIVAYDNEEKGDPKLPGYKAEDWKRHDTQVWARYLAEEVSRDGYRGLVCVLPAEWRDAKGKADWDGALRWLIDEHTVPEAETPADQWKVARSMVRDAFLAALRQARAARDLRQLGLFSKEVDGLIYKKLQQISYEDKLPPGDEVEEGYATKLTQLLHRARREERLIDEWAQGMLWLLAAKYREVKGQYYLLRPPKAKTKWSAEADMNTHWQQSWEWRLSTAVDPAVRWAHALMLKGTPESFSNFHIKSWYMLVRESGEYVRLIKIRNVHGEEWNVLRLDGKSFASPKAFREWLNTQTNVAFLAGERELQMIQRDMTAHMAHRQVYEVPYFGWHAPDPAKQRPAGLWFFDDLAIGDGKELRPDEQGVFWDRGKGYKIGDKDQEDEEFVRGRPRMHPERAATLEEVCDLLRSVAAAFYDTQGGPEGYMVLGAALGAAFAPEIFKEHGMFPGLWLPGETQQGKTTMARWCQAFFGIARQDGVILKDTTKVGLSIAFQQYSNLPVWLEEFQPESQKPEWEQIIEKIKNAFNRESGIKKTFGDEMRRVRCVVLVTGVATCADAQVRSRYIHSQVSKNKRLEDHLEWMQANKDEFYLIGRELLRRRPEMVAGVLRRIREFTAAPELAGVEIRSKLVHGVPYAVFLEVCEWFKGKGLVVVDEGRLRAYRSWLLGHTQMSSAQVTEQVNVNQFWRLLLNALRAGMFGEGTKDWRRYFRVSVREKLDGTTSTEPLDPELRAGWKSYRLYFQPGPVIDAVNQHLVRLRTAGLLNQQDLRAQMSQRDYWVHGSLKFRFGEDMSSSYAWAIEVDRHELGRQPVGREELELSLRKTETTYWSLDAIKTGEWNDPRKGDLFPLVHAVEDREEPDGFSSM